ncbi:hypothetical protein [Roseicyclus mahoneyensis]|uniref:hypothetical protein n=1 Tax=Roseicyclus mahoneyensis TaxID=164332 RepID=UPI0011B1F0F3|nr:hypothetical protein [Roseicyclus mahoneyensis]
MDITLTIWKSFRSIPLWVQIWVSFWLVPVNLSSLAFVAEDWGTTVAFLAIIAMALNVIILFVEQRFSRTMALPHLPFWTGLVILIVILRPNSTTPFGIYLIVLGVTNTVSLVLDYIDAYRWLKGDRG